MDIPIVGQRITDPADTATNMIMQAVFSEQNPRAPFPLRGAHYERIRTVMHAAMLVVLAPIEELTNRNAALQKAVDGLQAVAQENIELRSRLTVGEINDILRSANASHVIALSHGQPLAWPNPGETPTADADKAASAPAVSPD